MINMEELGARMILAFGDTGICLSESTLLGFLVAIFLAALGIFMGSGLKIVPETKRQIVAEWIVEKIYTMTESHVGRRYGAVFAPYAGTIFLYILTGSALGLFGVRPITADVNVTFSLSILTFLLIQISSLRALGLRGRAQELCAPMPLMLPMNLIEEVTLPVSLGLRLFGNIFGGMIVIELWMALMEWLSSFFCTAPVLRAVLVLPLNAFFDVFEPIIQTYIFVTLTLVFLGKALGSSAEGKAG